MNLETAFLLLLSAVAGSAATFHCDPAKGSLQGDGTADRPWPNLEQALQAKLVRLVDEHGKTNNPAAPAKSGDTLLLRSGWHGTIRIASGYNEQPITITAEKGQAPQVAFVEIGQGRNWIVRGLTISPSLAPAPLAGKPRHLVMLGERASTNSANLVVEDCFIYSVLDTSSWTAQDWVTKPSSGIWLGRHGKAHAARNNYVLNTRIGIDLCAPECVAEGNVIENFSADGMRTTRDAQLVQYNVIKNNFVSDADGDPNHDDGIQAFLFNAGKGTLRDTIIRGNIIIGRETDNLPFPNGLQGIGFFDGPLVHFLVESNVVSVSHYHGVSLYDAQDCTIRGNTCYSRWGGRAKPWVMLGQKKNQASGNTVRDNQAHSFSFKADSKVTAENNREVTAASHQKELDTLRAAIDQKFGALHPVAKRPRLAAGR